MSLYLNRSFKCQKYEFNRTFYKMSFLGCCLSRTFAVDTTGKFSEKTAVLQINLVPFVTLCFVRIFHHYKKVIALMFLVFQTQSQYITTPCPEKKEATLFSTTTLAFVGRFL